MANLASTTPAAGRGVASTTPLPVPIPPLPRPLPMPLPPDDERAPGKRGGKRRSAGRRVVRIPLDAPPAYIADVVDILIATLDAQDAAGEDLEPETDTCPAADDDPSPFAFFAPHDYMPGDADDAELNGDEHERSGDEDEPSDDAEPGDDDVRGQSLSLQSDYQHGMHAGPGPFQRPLAVARWREDGVYRREPAVAAGGAA